MANRSRSVLPLPILLALVLAPLSGVYAGAWTTISAPNPASGTITVTATASLPGLVGIAIFGDRGLVRYCSTSPCSLVVDTTQVTNGKHTIFSKRYDRSGLVTTSSLLTVTVSNASPSPTPLPPTPVPSNPGTPPTVLLTVPATVAGTVTVTVSATDPDGVSLTRVYIDGSAVSTAAGGSLVYGWVTTSVPNGSHTVQATAADSKGNIGFSAPANVLVNNVAPPPPPPSSPPPPSGAGVPLSYLAPTDRTVRPEGPLPAMGPRGSVVTDDISGFRILRVTDGNMIPQRPGRAFMSGDGSAEELLFNADGTRFLVIGTSGDWIPMTLNKAAFTTAVTPLTYGGPDVWYTPVGTPVWDPSDPNLLYGGTGTGVASFNVATQVLTPVWDTSALGGGPQSLSMGNNRRIAGYIGAQDAATIAVAKDLVTGQAWVFDTAAGRINGAAVAGFPGGYAIHNVRMGQEGRYVVLTGPYDLVWDLNAGTVAACTASCGGHKVQGYGYFFNNDSILGSGDWYQYQYLKRPMSALAFPVTLVGQPHPAGGTDSHANWGNAQAGVMAPLLVSSSGEGLGTGPVQAPYDREIFAIATDGSGTIWRLAHSRSFYVDFYDGPHASFSRDGRYVIFTSNWGRTLGLDETGAPRTDAFVVELRAP